MDRLLPPVLLGAPLIVLVLACLAVEEVVLGALLGTKLLYNLCVWAIAQKRALESPVAT